MAVRTGGRGDVTDTHRLWLHEEKKLLPQRVGSGVIVGDHIYILNESGVAWCLAIKTGEQLWEKRLAPKSWCSMVHAAGRLYATSERGDTIVLEPNPNECRVLAENKINELTRASLALSNGQVFQRTYEHLYCFE
jgi:outer membrane protein assembly factor BamB